MKRVRTLLIIMYLTFSVSGTGICKNLDTQFSNLIQVDAKTITNRFILVREKLPVFSQDSTFYNGKEYSRELQFEKLNYFGNVPRANTIRQALPGDFRFYQEALFYNNAFDFLEKSSQYQNGYSTTSTDLNQLFQSSGSYFDKIDFFVKSDLFNETTSLTFDYRLQDITKAKMRLGEVFVEKREYEQGIELYKQILNSPENNVINKNLVFEANSVLGNVYGILKKYDSALVYRRNALNVAEQHCLGIKKVTEAYRDLGLTLAEMGDKKASLKTYLEAIKTAKSEGGEIRNLGILYLLVAGSYEELEYYQTMGSYLDKYRDLKIDLFHEVDLEFHRLLSVRNKVNGDYELALNNLESMNSLNDSLFTLSLSDKLLTVNKLDKVDANEKESVIQNRAKENLILQQVRLGDKRISYLQGLLLGLCAIALVISLAFYRNQRFSRKLAQMNEKINSQRNEISESLENQKELNDKLHKANGNLEHFFSIIAHDLRSPYNVMLGYTDMLVDNFDLLKPADIKDCLLTLRRKAYKNYQLTQNLLSWAAMQKVGITVNKRELNIRKIVDAAFSLHNELANKKGITLINRCPTDFYGNLDKDIAKSVLSNLINNALKFTCNHGSVTINTKKVGEKVLFKIDDTGIGMGNKTRKKLFNLSKVTSRPGTGQEPGAGLGLILCQEMITTHEGTIKVKSKKGKGTTVLALF